MKKDKNEKKGKIHIGTVVSLKMQNTAIVAVERRTVHPLYKKVLKKRKKYKVDTGSETLSVGDKVKIVETKPISKDKHFRILGKEKNGSA